jgi:hypothetical protein
MVGPGSASRQWLLDCTLQQLLAYIVGCCYGVDCRLPRCDYESYSKSQHRVQFLPVVSAFFLLVQNWLGLSNIDMHELAAFTVCIVCVAKTATAS